PAPGRGGRGPVPVGARRPRPRSPRPGRLRSHPEALIAFDLSDLAGRVLLLGAVLVQSLVSVILLLFVFGPLIHQAVADAFASGSFNAGPIADASARIQGLSAYNLLNSIPALMFA